MVMEQLELKHLAPYLPYGLTVVLGTTQRNITAVSTDSNFVFVDAYKGSRDKQMTGLENIKPILRPLSDLTKEIEHNGEKFVPIEILEWNSYEHIINKGVCDGVGYQYMLKLFEWHFDAFGLIGKGLAIDINTPNR